jgi:hypothetical protein
MPAERPIRHSVAVPSVMPARSLGRVDLKNPPQPDSTPTIQVTIGRIEIRATALEPAPNRERAAPLPPLSLEAYLTRRTRESGGAP